jgi:hypothetical protein
MNTQATKVLVSAFLRRAGVHAHKPAHSDAFKSVAKSVQDSWLTRVRQPQREHREWP